MKKPNNKFLGAVGAVLFVTGVVALNVVLASIDPMLIATDSMIEAAEAAAEFALRT